MRFDTLHKFVGRQVLLSSHTCRVHDGSLNYIWIYFHSCLLLQFRLQRYNKIIKYASFCAKKSSMLA